MWCLKHLSNQHTQSIDSVFQSVVQIFILKSCAQAYNCLVKFRNVQNAYAALHACRIGCGMFFQTSDLVSRQVVDWIEKMILPTLKALPEFAQQIPAFAQLTSKLKVPLSANERLPEKLSESLQAILTAVDTKDEESPDKELWTPESLCF